MSEDNVTVEPVAEPVKYARGKHPNTAANIQRVNELRQNLETAFGGVRGNKTGGELGMTGGSYREAARYLSRQKMGKDKDGKMKLELPDEPTVAQFVMFNVIAKATKADMRSVEYLTEQVDGKVATTNINIEIKNIMGMSDAELLRYISEPLTIENESGGGGGVETSGDGEGNASEEDGRAIETGDGAGV